jgi:large subunit ribosomal protein L33
VSERLNVTLACSVCEGRNYKTTKRADKVGQLELRKFCPHCNKHTVHKETK